MTPAALARLRALCDRGSPVYLLTEDLTMLLDEVERLTTENEAAKAELDDALSDARQWHQIADERGRDHFAAATRAEKAEALLIELLIEDDEREAYFGDDAIEDPILAKARAHFAELTAHPSASAQERSYDLAEKGDPA